MLDRVRGERTNSPSAMRSVMAVKKTQLSSPRSEGGFMRLFSSVCSHLAHPGTRTILLFALGFLFSGQSLLAAVRTWTGASINDPTPANRNNFWTTAANWSGNAFPVPGDDLVFPTAAFQTASQNTYAPGTSFGKITIESHVMVGATIVLTNGISATGGQITLNGIKIANLQTFTVPGSNSSIVITSPIDTNGQSLRLDVTGTIVFTGLIGGSGEVRRTTTSGSGTAIFAAANTFGTCAVSSGTLLVAGQQPGVPMRVDGNATLAGNGTVGPLLVVPNQPGEVP